MGDKPVAGAATYTTHNKQRRRNSIHVLRGIRTRDPNNRMAAELRLKRQGYRDRKGPS